MIKYLHENYYWQGIAISVVGSLMISLTVGFIPAVSVMVLIVGYNTSFKDID